MRRKFASVVDAFRQLNYDFGPRWSLYLAIPLSFMLFVVWPLWRQYRNDSRPYYEKYRQAVLATVPARLDRELARITQAGKTVGSDPAEYFRFIDDAKRLFVVCDRARMLDGLEEQQRSSYFHCEGQMNGVTRMGDIDTLRRKYESQFGSHGLTLARMEWERIPRKEEFPDASAPSTPYLWAAYKGFAPFAAFFFILRLIGKEMSPLLEIVQLWRLALASLLWPIGLFVYPRGSIRSQLQAARRFATAGLSAGLSLFGGVAKASASGTSKDNTKKDKRDWSLQFDGRFTENLSNGNPNSAFLRGTLITSGGFVLESVNTASTKGSWFDSTVVGKSFSVRNTAVIPITGAAADSSGSRTLQAGVQVFHASRHFRWLMPAFNIERQVCPAKVSTFFSTGWALIPLDGGRKAVGLEYGLRMPQGKPVGWSLGPAFQMRIGRASFWEATLSRNQLKVWQGRLRLVHTFAW